MSEKHRWMVRATERDTDRGKSNKKFKIKERGDKNRERESAK